MKKFIYLCLFVLMSSTICYGGCEKVNDNYCYEDITSDFRYYFFKNEINFEENLKSVKVYDYSITENKSCLRIRKNPMYEWKDIEELFKVDETISWTLSTTLEKAVGDITCSVYYSEPICYTFINEIEMCIEGDTMTSEYEGVKFYFDKTKRNWLYKDE